MWAQTLRGTVDHTMVRVNLKDLIIYYLIINLLNKLIYNYIVFFL